MKKLFLIHSFLIDLIHVVMELYQYSLKGLYIQKNLYNNLGWEIDKSLDRSDWQNTRELISKGRDWIIKEIKDSEMLKGVTRDEFAKNIELQNRVWEERLMGNPDMFRKKRTGLLQDGVDIYNEYKPQLGDKLEYTPTELAALSNFLGRQGTRILMGDIMRDGMSMAEALPTFYGSNAEYDNKTPEQYIREFRAATR
mgnify:CR=1 FL=1